MLEDELFHVLRLVLQDHAAAWQAAGPQVTKPQYAVLLAVDRTPGIEQSALGGAAVATKATLAEMLQRMERHGLIERVGDPRDRRRRYVHLTERGAEVLRESRQIAGRVNGEFARELSVPEREQLLALLRRMVRTD